MYAELIKEITNIEVFYMLIRIREVLGQEKVLKKFQQAEI